MERFMWVLTLGVALTVTGCALFEPKETRYLKSAQDVATQQEVRENLGPPKRTTTTAAGEIQWVYEVRQLEPGSQNTWAAVGSWCDEYFLTFDRGGVLRRRRRERGDRIHVAREVVHRDRRQRRPAREVALGCLC